jgi:hypothetical protein
VLCSGRTFKGKYLKNMVRENLKIKREYSQGSVTSDAARTGGSKGDSIRKKRLEYLIKKDQANFFRFDISKEMMSNMHPTRSRRRRASGCVNFEKYQEHGTFYDKDSRDRRTSQGVSESIGSNYGQGNYLGIVDRPPKLGILATSNLWDTQHVKKNIPGSIQAYANSNMSIPANVKHDNKDIFTMSFLNAKEKSLLDPPNTKHSPFLKGPKSHSDASRN